MVVLPTPRHGGSVHPISVFELNKKTKWIRVIDVTGRSKNALSSLRNSVVPDQYVAITGNPIAIASIMGRPLIKKEVQMTEKERG